MVYHGYREIKYLLKDLREFRGNSAEARWFDDEYIVYSYDTPILILDRKNRKIVFNYKYYSNTTSKLQNLIIDAFPEIKKAVETNKYERVIYKIRF